MTEKEILLREIARMKAMQSLTLTWIAQVAEALQSFGVPQFPALQPLLDRQQLEMENHLREELGLPPRPIPDDLRSEYLDQLGRPDNET